MMRKDMKVNLVAIGNSKGIRIPSAILKQCSIENHVELEVEKNRVVLKSIKARPREGWDKAFRLMHERKDDTLLFNEVVDIEANDWEWK
jgi:antitoxin MazE